MKIRKIKFCNIHSLKGEHEIDFSSGILAEAGLFAITGPTGSGKSTLLDVITLALYNRIPRINKIISNNILEEDGGVMTRNAKDCYAEVEYAVKGRLYRSYWSIERTRNNTLKNRKQEIIAVESGNIIASGVSTPKKNEEIIGLNYEQFIKAMVLSQGQFSKLLKSTRDERNKLLEDITGAKEYRQIGSAVFRRFKLSENTRKEQDIRLGEIQLISKEEKTGLKKELEELSRESSKIKKKYDAFKDRIAVRKNIVHQTEQYELNNRNKKAFDIELAAFKEKKQALIQHNKLVIHREILNNNDQNNKYLSKEIDEDNQNIESKKQAVITKELIINEITKLIGEKVTEDNILNTLELFRKKISGLLEEERLFQAEETLHKNLLIQNCKEIGDFGVILEIKETPEFFLQDINKKRNEVSRIIKASGEKELDSLTKKIKNYRQNLDTAGNLLIEITQFDRNTRLHTDKETELGNGLKLVKSCETNAKKYKKDWIVLEKELETLTKQDQERRKYQSLDEHRKELKESEACPLCGSFEHPYADNEPYFDLQADNLNTKRKLYEATKKLELEEVAKAKAQVNINEKLKSELKSLKKQLEIELDKVYQITDKLNWKRTRDKSEIVKRQQNLKNKLNLLINSESAFRAELQFKNIIKTINVWEIALNRHKKSTTDREKLYTGRDIDNDVRKLTSKFTKNASLIISLNKRSKELKKEILKLRIASEKFIFEINNILSKEGIENLEKLQKQILEEAKAGEIRKKDQEYKDKVTRLDATGKLITKTLIDLKKKEDITITTEELTSQFNSAADDWKNLEKTIGGIEEKLDHDKHSRDKHKEGIILLESLKKDESLWKMMNSLIGDATGKKFSNFVQDLTLEQLIGYANKRLRDLSDRYILDIPTAKEAEKNDSLKVFDAYMGDARRSVNTLSGGETFMVSLAMAFALSDLASKNVNIDSIFIDEGFGTLDPETLEQAITILEKMQNEGDKSIGIISHVAALKERITTQIKLEKSGAGYSTIIIE